jgi:leucyl/phenylalanyl-tRNA--protein transferase
MQRSILFGPPRLWPDQDLIAFTEEIPSADMVFEAYLAGVFPMSLHETDFAGMGWWSPICRAVLPLGGLRVTRSLRQSVKRYTTTVDQAFDQVVINCADPRRPNGWIDEDIRTIYGELFRCGRAHSVETWDRQGRLVGGLYGVSAGGLFAGESMFHDPEYGRDASKVALHRLVSQLSDEYAQYRLIDAQWITPHLASMGVVEIDREEYLDLLEELLAVPEACWSE